MSPPSSIDATVRRLEGSLADLEWAVSLVPEAWHHRAADGVWSVAMNLAHLAVYEERLAAPSMEVLAAGRDARTIAPSGGEDRFLREEEALSREPLPAIMARLRDARRRQIEALRAFPEERFDKPVATLWGNAFSPAWVMDKTFQHTWEHGTTILQIALFFAR